MSEQKQIHKWILIRGFNWKKKTLFDTVITRSTSSSPWSLVSSSSSSSGDGSNLRPLGGHSGCHHWHRENPLAGQPWPGLFYKITF